MPGLGYAYAQLFSSSANIIFIFVTDNTENSLIATLPDLIFPHLTCEFWVTIWAK